MTGRDTGFATGAAVERYFKGVLLVVSGFGERDEISIVTGEVRLTVMTIRESSYWRLKLFLLVEEVVDECAQLWRWRVVLRGGRVEMGDQDLSPVCESAE